MAFRVCPYIDTGGFPFNENGARSVLLVSQIQTCAHEVPYKKPKMRTKARKDVDVVFLTSYEAIEPSAVRLLARYRFVLYSCHSFIASNRMIDL